MNAHSRNRLFATTAAALCAVAAYALLEPGGQVDVTGSVDYRHDTLGNILALSIGKSAAKAPPIKLKMAYYDKKGVKIGEPSLGGLKTVTNASIAYFEKSWAILLVQDADTTLYYSVKVGSSASILGTAATNDFLFCFAGKNGAVSCSMASNGTWLAQVYDKTLARVGATRLVLTNPAPLNAGTYFYCAHNNQVEIWRVKKGLDQAVNANGQFVAINEPKKLCCVQDATTHAFYLYK